MEYGKAKLNLMRNFCTAMMNLHCKSPLLLVFLQSEFQFTENNSHIFSIKMQFSTENKTKMKLDIYVPEKTNRFQPGTSKGRRVAWKECCQMCRKTLCRVPVQGCQFTTGRHSYMHRFNYIWPFRLKLILK